MQWGLHFGPGPWEPAFPHSPPGPAEIDHILNTFIICNQYIFLPYQGFQIAMVPTYSMKGPFRGHMSLKSSPFSPGPSCKLSNQYLIQDHMAAHYKNLMSAKDKDHQKRDSLIQALEKYKKDLVYGLPASSCNSRSVSPSQQKNYELQISSSEKPLSPGSQLEEKEEEYLRFLQDLTNDILIRNCYHKEALEDVFQMHIKSKRHNLDEEDHKVFAQKNCGVKPPNHLAEVKGRWKTAGKKEENSSKPKERAEHHRPTKPFHQL
ncbi:spermatogenesis-associated protein 7-like protein [Columba livia]|nr:spermatogenesis-associated protein 7-like protein [Columba livia]